MKFAPSCGGVSIGNGRGMMMRLPHFRVRTLMLAVVVVALLTWGGMMGTRSYIYYRAAHNFGLLERGWRETAARSRLPAEFHVQCIKYYALLARKYRRAMWRPWLPVGPDPHAPGWDQWHEQVSREQAVNPDPSAPRGRAASRPKSVNTNVDAAAGR